MTYDLFVADPTYSSWSMRGWLSLNRFGLRTNTHWVGLYAGTLAQDLEALPNARTVPALRCPDGAVLTDTIAMAETLAERHPDVGFWPEDAQARAAARSLVAEMHSGFAALRAACPMNLNRTWVGFEPGEDVRADLARLEQLWSFARSRFGNGGPWLFGAYSIADAFFAPVAGRIAGYGLNVGPEAQAYVTCHLTDDAFRQWRAIGRSRPVYPVPYELDHEQADWPGPRPQAARALENGVPRNATCPFSGKPATFLMETGGLVLGFCNAGCRDKVVADPLAWPEVRALLEQD